MQGAFICWIDIPSYSYRTGAKTLIRGDVYSYIRLLPDQFLLKSTLLQKKLVGQNLNI